MKKITALFFFFFFLTVSAINFNKPQLILKSNYDRKGFDFYKCKDIIIDKKGNIYLLDQGNSRLLKYNSKGEFLLSIGSVGKGPESLYNPDAIALVENSIWIADTGNNIIKIVKNDKIVGSFKVNNMALPQNICNVANNVFISAGLHNEKSKSIAIFNRDMKFIKCISAGISIDGVDNRVLGLWNSAKLVSSSDKKNMYVCFLFYPVIKKINGRGELQNTYNMKSFYNYYMDDKMKAPAGYAATAFSSGPNGTFFVAVCNNEKKQCGKLIQLNSMLNKIIYKKQFNKHIWYMNYFKKHNKFVIITSEDEVLFYDTSK